MKASYELTYTQKAVREDLTAMISLLDTIQIKNVVTEQSVCICDLLKAVEPVPYGDLVYEVIRDNSVRK
jgi:hypothetical protein